MELIKEVEGNPPKLRKTTADEFGKSTLSSMWKQKEKCQQQYLSGEENAARIKSPLERTDQALLRWYTRRQGTCNARFILIISLSLSLLSMCVVCLPDVRFSVSGDACVVHV